MRGIDWFSGVGGYTLAMRRSGIEVVGACERDRAKRAAYVERCGIPPWFGEECMDASGAPDADMWTACASVPALLEWLGERSLPLWVVMECVRRDLPELLRVVLGRDERACSVLPAGERVFVLLGPRWLTGYVPRHDGQGPESNPEALDLVLRAIVETT